MDTNSYSTQKSTDSCPYSVALHYFTVFEHIATCILIIRATIFKLTVFTMLVQPNQAFPSRSAEKIRIYIYKVSLHANNMNLNRILKG